MNALTTMTREQITREFAFFGTIIPASSADATRRRTAYFYKREAMAWGRMARQWWPGGGDMRGTCKRLAMHYLGLYHEIKSRHG
jgi:hypothetical protein